MSKALDFSFRAALRRQEGGMGYHRVPVPPEAAMTLLEAGVRRVLLHTGDKSWRRALSKNKDGEHFLILGQTALRELGWKLGQERDLRIVPDPEPDLIELGEEFEAVLEQDEEAARRFYSFTPGIQRSLAHYTTSAKKEETRIRRALELAHKIKTGGLYMDKKGNAKNP
jgi:hypothetical protein